MDCLEARSRMSSVPHSHLQWLKKVEGQEHVTFENFVTQFELTDQPSAIHAYQQLIALSEIRKTRRSYLQNSFDFFRKNREMQFWARRGSSSQHGGCRQSRLGCCSRVWPSPIPNRTWNALTWFSSAQQDRSRCRKRASNAFSNKASSYHWKRASTAFSYMGVANPHWVQ